MSKLWKKIIDAAGVPQVKEVTPLPLKISSPTIIYLSGALTTDKAMDYIGGGINAMEELLQAAPELSPVPQIYAWSHTSLKYIFNVVAYNSRPQKAYSAAAESFARGIIIPLVSQGGTPLPLEEAQKNLRNLTFFGYSAGTVLAQEAFNISLKLMQDMGYKKEEARKALQEIVLISIGNISRPTKEKDRFTTLYLVASNDIVVRWKNRLWVPLKSLFNKYVRELTIKPLSRTSLLITAAVKKKMWEWHRTPKGGREKKDIKSVLPSWIPVRSNHELPHYITTDDEHSQFSKIVLHAMVNALKRKSTIEVSQLLEPLSSLSSEENKAYRERITKATIKKPD